MICQIVFACRPMMAGIYNTHILHYEGPALSIYQNISIKLSRKIHVSL